MADVKTWDVPPWDPGAEAWVGWSSKFGGYYLGMRTPEESTFCTDAFPNVPALMVGTVGAVMWDKVPASVLAELEHAPTTVFLDTDHIDRHEQAIALTLRRALGS